MSDILMIGIAGGTGSGKSTLTERIKDFFGANVTVLMHDNYYKAHDDMTYEERTHLNYDHPNAFDTCQTAAGRTGYYLPRLRFFRPQPFQRNHYNPSEQSHDY